MKQYFRKLIWFCMCLLVTVGPGTLPMVMPSSRALAQEESPLDPYDRALEFEDDAANFSSSPSNSYPSSYPSTAQSSGSSSGSSRSVGSRSATPPKPRSNTKPMARSRNGDKIENVDFQDAEIEDIVRTISQLTGKNFILDPKVKGKISIVAPSAVSVDEVYKAFLSALAINGFTVVPSGKFYKILPSRAAQRDSIDTELHRAPPATDQMVTRIIKLKHITAGEVNRNLRMLISKDGDMLNYDPTNSLIISDYGANIRRIMKILDDLDKPGSAEQMAVIPVRFAKAKELATMIDQLINKGQPGGGANRPPGFPGRGISSIGGSGSKLAELSLVTPDERTNSLVVLGNQEGIDKVRALVEELDFNLDPADGGGVFVYRLKHSVAEQLAATLNGLASQSSPRGSTPQAAQPGRAYTPPGAGSVFGGDVKVTADKNTNSLIIVAGKQDYDIVRGLLAKLDVPRDQVFVEAIIMEINTDKVRDWKILPYYLDPASNGIGRAGFAAAGALAGLLNPANDAGLTLGFATGQQFTLQMGDKKIQVPSILSFVNFLQRHADANILSTPQILAMDNEEAQIEVGDQVPIGVETTATQSGIISSAPKFDKASIKLVITPHISPESNTIRMKVDQSVKQASEATVRAAALKDIATIISDRSIKTNIVVESQDTVVLGGLIRDEETHTETKVPLLGDIPVIGWLFKSSAVTRKKINLLVFLTPKIIRSQEDSRALLSEKVEGRKEWVKQNVLGIDPFGEKVEDLLREPPVKPPPTSNDSTSAATTKAAPSVSPSPSPSPAPSPSSVPSSAPTSTPTPAPWITPTPTPTSERSKPTPSPAPKTALMPVR